jgi:hypothetical protein
MSSHVPQGNERGPQGRVAASDRLCYV